MGLDSAFPSRLAAGALFALAACSSPTAQHSAPLDRVVYPTGLAVVDGRLVVASSNFDRAYDQGSVLSFDLAADPATLRGGVRVASFGGDLAIADASACGLPDTQVLLAARADERLYRLDLDASGAPTCSAGCEVPLDRLDPYGIAVTCPAGGPARAWVGHLTTSNDTGYLSVVDLATGAHRSLDVAEGGVRGLAWDSTGDRLFFTTYYGKNGGAWLGWISLAGGCTPGAEEWDGGCPVRTQDVTQLMSGIDLAGIALSNDQPGLTRRAYVAARVYDTDKASSSGSRPSGDIGGLLLVLELQPGQDGEPTVTLVRSVSIGLGVSEVRTLPVRSGQRDLVVVTATDDDVVAVYDDDAGEVRAVFTHDETTGAPVVGDQPFGLAVESRSDSTARVYVGSFEDDYVTPIDVPLAAPWEAALVHEGGVSSAPIVRIGAAP